LATRVSARLSRREGRRFGLTVGAAFLVLAALAAWRGRAGGGPTGGLAGVGLLLILAALVAPTRLGPLYHGWMRLAEQLSRVTTPVFMAVIYFGLVTPTGFLRRLLGHNQIARRRSARTFWVTREAGARRRTDMARQF
jgi:hypothetical protein